MLTNDRTIDSLNLFNHKDFIWNANT